MSTVKTAPIAACTPAAMAASGVPFRAAHWFHTRGRAIGPRSATELTVFQMVRQIVGVTTLPLRQNAVAPPMSH
jgi:hypothetical protein